MHMSRYMLLLTGGVLLLFFGNIHAEERPGKISAMILQFSENEPGVGRYPVTMSITPEYLRIDDTKARKDFILFSRKAKVIYSISSDYQQIIAIPHSPVDRKSPVPLTVNVKQLPPDRQAPVIAGKNTRHLQLIVNNTLCMDVISVPGLLPDAVEALKTFKLVLAGQQAQTLQYIPADMHEVCDLSSNTFHPTLSLDNGFPVLQRSSDGYSRELINYYRQDIDSSLFELPETYTTLNLD